jgi:glycosyltransferase involved in cell wall biosynthesis
MIWLYSDVLFRAGGIETYLHALATHLQRERIPFRVVVAELERCPLVDELVAKGVDVYRQRRVLGDRWLIRQRIMMSWLGRKLGAGDWVYCVRQPMPQLYLPLVRLVHRAHAKIGASWMIAPEFLPPPPGRLGEAFKTAVHETDAVISMSRCTVGQFERLYGYSGPIHVVRYHNLSLFDRALPLPPQPPLRIGYLGRLDTRQKDLHGLLLAFATLAKTDRDIELHLYGGGPAEAALRQQALQLGIASRVFFHGSYDHRFDLPQIILANHFFVYPSFFEGAPFSLLEVMQAGRFCVVTNVGGVPDLYEGHPEVGLMTKPNSPEHLARTLKEAVDIIAQNAIDSDKIRSRYFEGFDMSSAHRAWAAALQSDENPA